MKNLFLFLFFYLLIFFSAIFADENKNITIVTVRDTGKSETTISREPLDECITDIPDLNVIQGVSFCSTYYLKGIGGNNSNNDWVKDYTATVEVPYMLQQSELIIVTTKSIHAVQPKFQKVNKKFRRTKTFSSDHSNGNSFGGRSKRRYYFSTAEKALEDAKTKAKIWLSQQAAVICKNNKK